MKRKKVKSEKGRKKIPNLAYENCNHHRFKQNLFIGLPVQCREVKDERTKKKKGKKEIFNNENGKLFFKKPNYCCASSIECKKLNSDGIKMGETFFQWWMPKSGHNFPSTKSLRYASKWFPFMAFIWMPEHYIVNRIKIVITIWVLKA